MEKPQEKNSGIEFFKKFCNNPKDFDLETVQGAHKYLNLVLSQKISSTCAKKSVLIDIFNEFIDEPVRDYVFHRISRKLLLELAIRILQEFITRGVDRAQSLKLVLAKATTGKQPILIAPNDSSSAASKSPFSAPEVLDATFHLSDRSGLSPDVSFSIGKKRPPAFHRPDKTGYFTPSKGARKSLTEAFKVHAPLFKFCLLLKKDSALTPMLSLNFSRKRKTLAWQMCHRKLRPPPKPAILTRLVSRLYSKYNLLMLYALINLLSERLPQVSNLTPQAPEMITSPIAPSQDAPPVKSVRMGDSDEFGHFPDIDSSVAPSDLKAWSIAPDDADAQAESDLTVQTNLRRIAEQRTIEIEARCYALQKKLDARKNLKKRKAVAHAAGAARAGTTHPKKRATPPSSQPFTDILASQKPTSSDDDSHSDDGVTTPEESYAKLPTFEQLNSILCEYKSGRLRPSFDGNVSYKVCAEMCEEESDDIDTWTPDQKRSRQPMIISALRLAYKDKKEEWFSKPFLVSPSGAAQYWQLVLRRRAEIWRAAHEKALSLQPEIASSKSPITATVQERLKEKIRALSAPTSPQPAKPTPSPGRREAAIVISSGEESSGSSSVEDTEAGGSNSDVTHRKRSRKTAPDPNTHYSASEIKKFANMAKTIRNVNEAKGHSHAVADFIDLEFSDNSGMMAKARRSKDPWTKLRFETACNKAVRIMEER